MLQNIYIIIQLKHFKNCYRKSFAGKKKYGNGMQAIRGNTAYMLNIFDLAHGYKHSKIIFKMQKTLVGMIYCYESKRV